MSKASQPLFFTNNGPSRILEFRFSQLVLSHLSPADGDILQAAQQNRPHNIKNLSDPIKEAMLAIAGPEAAGPLGIPFNPASSKPRVTHDHLINSGGENAITWTLIHRSYLPPDTQGVNSKCKTGDRIVFDSMIGAPYLQGDHRSANPKGALDFACSFNCRDLLWIDSQFCFVSDAYVWDKQYLAQIRKQSQDRLIYGRPLPGLEPFTYKSACIVYKATAQERFFALDEIAGQAQNTEARFYEGWILRPGSGVIFDLPLNLTVHAPWKEQIFGSVLGFAENGDVIFRLHLGRDNIPCWLLHNLGLTELIQTNVIMALPGRMVSGAFRIWPAQLFQASCIPAKMEEQCNQTFCDRIVVCSAKFEVGPDDIQKADSPILTELMQGARAVQLCRMRPFPSSAALGLMHHSRMLHSQGFPHAMLNQPHLGWILRQFVLSKAQHAKTSKDAHTMHPRIAGPSLMEILFLRVDADKRSVSIINGNLVVTVIDASALHAVFGFPVLDKIDLTSQGFGYIQLYAPFTFKYSLYDTVEDSGPIEGSVSISIGAYTEYDRHGTGVIKSSKCHPDATLTGQRDPAAKKPRHGSGGGGGGQSTQSRAVSRKTASTSSSSFSMKANLRRLDLRSSSRQRQASGSESTAEDSLTGSEVQESESDCASQLRNGHLVGGLQKEPDGSPEAPLDVDVVMQGDGGITSDRFPTPK